jgi:Icc-related predicted phosphoesterase
MKMVAISDQHGHLPGIPECDLLVVAGDLCPDGFKGIYARHFPKVQLQWWHNVWLPWRRQQPARQCFITWGNHDYCGALLPDYDDGTTRVVVDGEVGFYGVRFWLTPWSNQFMDWAFMKQPSQLWEPYDKIPVGIDVLVSHQPPTSTGTRIHEIGRGEIDIGSIELGATIDRVKPRVVICGHIHGAHGRYVRGAATVYNVSVVDEQYRMVNAPTEILHDARADATAERHVRAR